MASDVEIRDFSGYLFVRVVQKGILLRAILSALLAVVVVWFIGWRFLRWPFLLPLSVLVAGTDLWFVMRTKVAELKITSLEFISRAQIESWYGRTRGIQTSNIRWLEYQPDTTGPETAHHPGGLYAVLNHRSVCLLPYITEAQTGVVIERIMKKFPELEKQWKAQSAFGAHFTTLGLDQSFDQKQGS